MITGKVTRFAEISPSRIRLSGKAEEMLERTISIKPREEYPFEILSVKTRKSSNITTELKEIKTDAGIEYELKVTNIRKDKGSYRDSIILKTNSKVKPEITINVSGYIMPSEEKKS